MKVVLLCPDVSVAYAGGADHSLDVIRRAPVVASFEETLGYFHDAHVKSKETVDFLVSCASTRVLSCIKEGGVEMAHSECWIGDTEAFDEYCRQKKAASVPPGIPSDLEGIARANQAFSSLLQDRNVPTVGGLMQSVGSSPNGFMYAAQAAAYYPSQEIPSGLVTPLSFGQAAQGGFAYTLLVPEAPGVSIVAAHFCQGALGFVYAPLVADKPIQVSNVSHEQLKGTVLERFGVAVDGVKFG